MRLAPLVLAAVPACFPQSANTPVAAVAAVPPGAEMPAHETLYYNVEWRLINAGRAKVDFQRQAGGQTQVNLRLESVGLVSTLYKVEDNYSANLTSSLCAESVQMTAHEGSRLRETKITFDGPAHHADYLERDRVKNTILLQHEIEIPPCVHDVVGGLMFMRTLNLEVGQSTTAPISDGKRSVMAKVEAQSREDIRTPEGTFHTICYEVYLFNNVLYRRPAHLNIWLTDDRRKLPVQVRVRMQITIGTITLLLQKHE
jgi:hypothetical protein